MRPTGPRDAPRLRQRRAFVHGLSSNQIKLARFVFALCACHRRPSLILAKLQPFCQTARAGGKPKAGWLCSRRPCCVEATKTGAENARRGRNAGPSLGAFDRAPNTMMHKEKNFISGSGAGFAAHSAGFADLTGRSPAGAPIRHLPRPLI